MENALIHRYYGMMLGFFASLLRLEVPQEIEAQHRTLVRKLNGHYAYYGVTSNFDALARLWHEVVLTWRKWLSRRSQKAYLSWAKMTRLLERYPLPAPRIVHRYITQRS